MRLHLPTPINNNKMKNSSSRPDLNRLMAVLHSGGKKSFQACARIANLITGYLERNEAEAAHNSLKVVADTYNRTDCPLTKLAIENVLLYRLASFISLSRRRQAWTSLMPRQFRDMMMQHLVPFGI